MSLDVLVTRPAAGAHGPPVLLVHGAWHGAWCWTEHFTGFLADHGFTSYALDLRGHGESPGHLARTRIAHYVSDVHRVAVELDAAPVVIGHSMGGFVVQHYLASYRAAGGVLMAPVPRAGATGATVRTAIRHPLAFLRANATWSLGPIVDDHERAKALLFSEAMSDDEARRHTVRLQDESYLAYLEMLLDLPDPSRVRDPLLVVGGAEDALFAPWEVEATARAYGVEAVIFPGIGHDMMLDVGWEAPAAAITDWIDRLDSSSSGHSGVQSGEISP